MQRVDYHNHTGVGSNIRLIDSINSVEGLIDKAIELGLAGIAITDHEMLGAHPKALKYMESIRGQNPDFKLILGNEIYLVDENPNDVHYHYILLAKDAEGHKLLRILSSLAWMNCYSTKGMTRVDTLKSDLERYVKKNPGHLIASTACIGGELGQRVLAMTAAEKSGDTLAAQEQHDAIVKFILWNKKLFGDDFYIETQPGTSKEQITVNRRLLSIAKCFNIKMTCTSDSHYLRPEDRYVHKAFLNSKDGDREVDAFYAEAYLHTNEEMIRDFAKSDFDPSFVEQMFQNTLEIAEKVSDYSLFHTQQIPKVKVKDYPKKDWDENNYPVLKEMFKSDDIINRNWVNQCVDKLKELNLYNETYLSRLEEEADVKKDIGQKLDTNIFAYPLTLQYYIDKFWELGSTVGAGRGSSCSGLNHWLLGVTQLDPIKWQFPFFRYLNKERLELPDIDVDLAPSKRPLILDYIKKERGINFNADVEEIFRENLGCTLVATFGTETSKSCILTACRGYRSEEYPDGINNDEAQELSSLIPSERGFVWSISDTYYGNEKKDRKRVDLFKQKIDEYPGLLEIVLGIEGVVSRRGSHASGVIFNDDDPFKYMAYMRAPNGDVTTQYDLHDAEWAGMTKYDFLVTEVQDKITQTIAFLQEYNEIEPELSLKEVYDKYFHPNVLPIETDEATWKAIQNVTVLSLFQFDSEVGAQAAKKIKPRTMRELSDSNGLMRLMPMENGETPLDKYVKYKNNISLWYDEMKNDYHLTQNEITAVERHFAQSYGVPPSQEQLMTMLMDPDICGFTLGEANTARKIVGKKQVSKVPELHAKVMKQAKSENLGRYIWECGIGPQMSYSFSTIHATAYSFIGFQTAYLATRWNPIYWNTACLVIDSGSLETNNNSEVETKEKGSDYSKIARAIGAITSRGIDVSLVNINSSDYGFKPDAGNNRILYGLKGLSNIGDDVIEKIKAGRPYYGIKDFMQRCPLNKTVTINLIKAGAFDEIDKDFNGNRVAIMAYYLSQNCDAKKKLTLQNFGGLIQNGIIPKDLELQIRVYNFTKYLKASRKVGKYYTFDDICTQFFERFFPDEQDKLEVINGIVCIPQTKWDKIYQKQMDVARNWLKEHQEEVLKEYNTNLFAAAWEKYAEGNTSHWEMQSMCFYHGKHELADVNLLRYGISDFNSLPAEAEIDYYFKRGGHQIPIFKLRRIAGTVIAKNDVRCSISLLTTTGVVNVKFTREYFAMFKKQISQIQADGTKKVVEKGWFSRGNMLVVTGFRRGDSFVGKTYKNTETHQLYKIDKVVGDELVLRHERFSGDGTLIEEEME